MCKWYWATNYLLLSVHFVNLLYYSKLIAYQNVLYATLVINIMALIAFLIYRFTVGITKMLRLYGTR
jgi:hypothetical protein